MKKVFFVHQVPRAMDLDIQSDGAEFVKIPDFNDGKIYFYCSEWNQLWTKLESFHTENNRLNLRKMRNGFVSPTLREICEANLIDFVDTVKEYDIKNDGSFDVVYIHLRNRILS